MKETGLKWKGRIGSLKALGFLVIIVACFILAFGVSNLNLAAKNSGEGPQNVTISQLVNGEIDSGRYVSVSGVAEYEVGYEETEDGRKTRNFYFLIDPNAGSMILIEHTSAYIVGLESGNSATITGMTRSTPTDLGNAIEGDLETYRGYGVETSAELYVKDGDTPPSVTGAMTTVCITIPVLILCVISFFFPSTVFGPYPVDSTATPSGRPRVKATGRFQRLAQIEPTIEVGKGSQKFTNVIANVGPPARGRVMIYIHHIVKTRTYGITVSTRESDWGVFFDTSNVHAVEPGKIYGWKTKWAVRFQYQGAKDKLETLYLIFEQAADQAWVVNLLRQSGFMIETVAEMS